MKTNVQLRNEVNIEIINKLKNMPIRDKMKTVGTYMVDAGNLAIDIAILKAREDCIKSIEELCVLNDDVWTKLKKEWVQ